MAAGIDALAALAEAGEPLDLQRVYAVGHSAGGHLALWAARAGLPPDVPGANPRVELAGAIGQAPVADLDEAARLNLSGGAVRRLLGGGPAKRPDRYALAYVLEGLAAARGAELRVFDTHPIDGPTADDVEDLCARGDVALLCLSHVAYRSGAVADLPTITAAARAHGTTVVWDLSHSAGAVPIELERAGAELAVGCTYKYLNGGPGAPAFLYVRRELQDRLRSPVQGWFGQRDQFAMELSFEPEPGIRRFLAGTPAILDLTAVEAGVELVAEAGIEAVGDKGAALTELIVELHDAWLAPLGFELGTPREPAGRGAHVSLRHEQAWPICVAYRERARVITDFRGPDSIRLGVPALYTRFVDVSTRFSACAASWSAASSAGSRPARRASPENAPRSSPLPEGR